MSIAQFADDIVLYYKFNSTKRGKSIVQKAVGIVEKNLSELGLKFTPNKTILIHFNNKRVPQAA